MPLRYANLLMIALIAGVPGVSADRSGTAIIPTNTFLDLDTGHASSLGGDVLWDGAALIPQGSAGLHNLGKYGARGFKYIRASHAAAATYSTKPIPAGSLGVGDVFGVRTNGGNYVKVIVTGADAASLSLQYTTFAGTAPSGPKSAAAAVGPVITLVQNNYSWIVPGLPNYGIAPGAIFIIGGTGLSDATPPVLQSSLSPGLPKMLHQTSVSVTVNKVTTTPALYYTSSTSVAAVLPSTTPTGMGTITVTYNGVASTPAPIQVVANAVGLDTLNGTGEGTGVVTDISFNLIGLTHSAMPNQTVVFWGSGIGADTGNDDLMYPQNTKNLTNIPMQVYIGGISATVQYQGRSPFPGLDQYNVVVPSGVSPGCFVSVVAMTGSVVSNTVTLPVSPAGGTCSDPASGLSGTQLQALSQKAGGGVNSMLLGVIAAPNGAFQAAVGGLPLPLSGAEFGPGYEYASQGSCIIVPPAQGSISGFLDAGTIQVSIPSGQSITLSGLEASLPGGAVAPGTYTFTGSGGKDIGSFKTALAVQTPLTWTNRASLATITRSQGATVTWSGGFPNGDVQVTGDVGGKFGTVRFYCHAPSSAGQLTLSPAVLMALPAGSGNLEVSNFTVPQTVTATGLDVGLAVGTAIFEINATFK